MEQRERKIYLSELFKYIRKNFIKVIIGSIIISVLFTVYMYVTAINTYEKNKQNEKEIIDIEDLTYDEKKIVDNLIMMQDRASYHENYIEKSYLLNMDVNNVTKVILQYYVDSEYKLNLSSEVEMDYTSSLIEMYYMYLSNNQFMKQVMGGLEQEYIKELFSIYTNYDAKMLSIYVYVPNGVDANVVKDKVVELVKAKEKDIQVYGEHKLVTVMDNIVHEYDSSIESKIYSTRKTISDTKSQVIVIKEQLNAKQQKYLKQYYDYNGDDVILEKPSISIKNIVLGIVMGIIFMCVYFAMKSILSGKLQCADDMRIMFGLKVFDKTTVEDKYIASAIKCICERDNINKLFLISTVNTNEEIIDKVATTLKSSNIEVVKGNSIVDDPVSLENMYRTNNVVLIEKLYVSKYNDIAENLQIIMDNNINIVGSIIFN
ncbi:MAG: hypothetical protein IJD58_00700 [Lachnospiraceae bacterium]|nr:hypothetical protein [Lachnospiraceae bacterium]